MRRWRITAKAGPRHRRWAANRIPPAAGRPIGYFIEMYSAYILKSLKDGSYYIGSTSDLKSRLERHNAGHSRFTRLRTPYKVVYAEHFETRAQAVRREIEMKSYKGGEAFKKLISVG